MASSKPRIGFVGVDAMGAPMAACVVKAGYMLSAYDRDPEHSATLAKEHGTKAAASLRELGDEADVIITILPNSAIVEQVLFSEQGLAASLRPGTVAIEMTSGIPTQTQASSQRLADQEVVLFDAP